MILKRKAEYQTCDRKEEHMRSSTKHERSHQSKKHPLQPRHSRYRTPVTLYIFQIYPLCKKMSTASIVLHVAWSKPLDVARRAILCLSRTAFITKFQFYTYLPVIQALQHKRD